MTIECTQSYLSVEQACLISSKSEREFALRCLAVGCLVLHQVPVGGSVIDFLVVNPKRLQFEEHCGKLVEVTCMTKDDLYKKRIKRCKKSKCKTLNTTAQRKIRQIEAMKASGHPWTILYAQ